MDLITITVSVVAAVIGLLLVPRQTGWYTDGYVPMVKQWQEPPPEPIGIC